jgi:hypothetical protein
MLEQAIIDAAALREAALKNAEQSLIEKYAPQIKKAVQAMLEQDDSKRMKYEGRTVSVVYEADGDGKVTVSENGDKPFVVNEAELSELTEEELINEEEMGAPAMDAGGPDQIEAPFAGNPSLSPDQEIDLSMDVEEIEDFITLDLGKLEQALAPESEESDTLDPAAEEPELDMGGLEDLEGGDTAADEEEPTDSLLEELLSMLEENDVIEEEIEADMGETKDGTFRTDKGTLQYYRDMEEAKGAHHDEEEDEDEEEDTSKLQETIDLLLTQNQKFELVVTELSNKLDETLLSNAKLIYQNRTLGNASLNERQKSKIVEAIAKAESPKEAKRLHETLTTTVGSESNKGPQSLSESVNKRSNLSGMLNRRQNLKESKNSDDSFVKKMQKLAGIK